MMSRLIRRFLKICLVACFTLTTTSNALAQSPTDATESKATESKATGSKATTEPQDTASESTDTTQDETPESLKITIKDEPKTVDPATLVPLPSLATKYSVEFNEASIREVVAWLKSEAGVTVLLSEADLADANILLSEPVTDRLNQEPLYLLLDRLAAINLGWFVEGEILHITTLAKAKDQLKTIPHNVGAFFDKGFKPESLNNAILAGTDFSRWEQSGVGSGTLVLLGDVLFVRQSDRMHRQVNGLLIALGSHGRRTFIDDPIEHEALREKLENRVSVDFEDTPLSEAIQTIVAQTGADIRIDQASFRRSRIRDREPVSLTLRNQSLSAVLEALVANLRLTWTLQNGTILITTTQTANELLKAAVFDVRDLARDDQEALALKDAIMMQTVGQWEDDGGNGAIVFAKPGVMVVRQTEKTMKAVLDLLEIYREALKVSKVRKRDEEDPQEPLTRYYRMPSKTARDLELNLRTLVAPKSWKMGQRQDALGTITRIASRPELVNAKPTSIVIENDVLIIHQTRENHDTIAELIFKIENGDLVPYITSVEPTIEGGLGGGGFGGGFFSVPPEMKSKARSTRPRMKKN